MWGSSYDMFDELFFYGRGRMGRMREDPFGYDGDVNRNNFAAVSQRALGALDQAKKMFLAHLANADTSKGEVTEEIIKFHLVPDMRKKFSKFVKEYGCMAIPRQISRAEQDLINKSRKSLLWYTAVKVTPTAQQEYLAKHPNAAKVATAPTASSSASASTSSGAPSISGVSGSGPLKEVADHKLKRKLNEAAVQRASTSSAAKKIKKKA